MSVSPLTLLVLLAPLVACTGKTDDTATPAGDDTADTAVDGGPAELAPLSSGACPDFSTSGTSTFLSSDEERQVTVVIPSSPGTAMPVNFFFHGVADPASSTNPGGDTASALDLQALADSTNTVWIVPDAPVQNLLGVMNVYLWDLTLSTDHDLVLYDDLRTCAAQNLDVDLSRLSIVGFSGGALWTTVITVHRADTIATAVELSGGSDVTAPGFDTLLAEYTTPVTGLPVLLTTGADAVDVWPSTSMVVVDFAAATDTLQGELLADSHFVVRCQDDNGHEMGRKDWNIAQDWLAAHSFGQPSPYATDGLGNNADWCAVAAAE